MLTLRLQEVILQVRLHGFGAIQVISSISSTPAYLCRGMMQCPSLSSLEQICHFGSGVGFFLTLFFSCILLNHFGFSSCRTLLFSFLHLGFFFVS